ncbi:hypothetical protein B0I35DRAFT_478611 [Stachybotrys elegans]|uniref:Uncharacterized protein n=1 Tax=Stachybotrys elegans TaxID=80388 RepID=A0A8K0SNC5_9HYPO|nr:hypothetical protein B0I35DRAFT_478611 [Stachybotrys elegans]
MLPPDFFAWALTWALAMLPQASAYPRLPLFLRGSQLEKRVSGDGRLHCALSPQYSQVANEFCSDAPPVTITVDTTTVTSYHETPFSTPADQAIPTPETSSTPETTPTLEPTLAPETTPILEPTPTPETTSTPDTPTPETILTSETTPTLEATPTPEAEIFDSLPGEVSSTTPPSPAVLTTTESAAFLEEYNHLVARQFTTSAAGPRPTPICFYGLDSEGIESLCSSIGVPLLTAAVTETTTVVV